ncbi:MAG: 50S ribosomal protein L32 [Saprospiraceae bacterium]|jgi:large subunit ribosomal protein L32
MANPRTRTSKRRKRARRTHYKATAPNVATCSVTGEAHMMHRAYYDDEGNMRYRGRVLVKAEVEDE